MRLTAGVVSGAFAAAVMGLTLWIAPYTIAQNVNLHDAPASEAQMKNPYQGQSAAVAAGKKLYGQNCALCHGHNLQGIGPAPALDGPAIKSAKPGELYWFITTGKVASGMPSWSGLPKQQRWQIIAFLQSSGTAK